MSQISEPEPQPMLAWQFSIGGILLVITLIAICLALLRLAPCPGVMLTLVCFPAAIRAMIRARHSARLGERLTLAAKVREFCSSFLIVLWIEVMAGFSGVAISSFLFFPLALLFNANVALGLALIPGVLFALTAFLGLMWMLRPGLP